MFQGELTAIYVASEAAGPMKRLESVEAVAGGGLVGDRFARRNGGAGPRPDQELTLIEIEAIEAAVHDYRLEIHAGLARRNLVTRGVPLNHLVGRQFTIGEVLLEGLELCEPCGHLEKLAVPGIRKALTHRGGLRAKIITGGRLREGNRIRPHEG
jgi:MOSC domain-containing protein YiiM